MVVVEEVGSHLTHRSLSRQDTCPERGGAKGALEVSRVVWRILLFVDRLEDANWNFFRVPHDVGSGGTLVC